MDALVLAWQEDAVLVYLDAHVDLRRELQQPPSWDMHCSFAARVARCLEHSMDVLVDDRGVDEVSDECRSISADRPGFRPRVERVGDERIEFERDAFYFVCHLR